MTIVDGWFRGEAGDDGGWLLAGSGSTGSMMMVARWFLAEDE